MYKVMIAEDSKPIMRNIVQLIASIDSRLEIVETANNGREALRILESTNIDILFTDIRMPILDGLELIREAKKLQPSMQCVIISGHDDFVYAKQAIKLQVNEYILKPVDYDELKKVIVNLMNKINQETNSKLERILNESIPLDSNQIDSKNRIIKQYVILVTRVGLLKRGNIIIDKTLLYRCLEDIETANDYWLLDTGFSCEIAIVLDMTRNRFSNLSSICTQIRACLLANYNQVNIVSSPIIQDIYKLREQYINLSNTLSSLIVLGESEIYDDFSEASLHLSSLQEESISIQRKLAMIIKSRQQNLFEYEIRKHLRDWEKFKYPAIFVKRFLSIVIDEISKEYSSSDMTLLLDINAIVDNILVDCLSFNDLYMRVIDYYTASQVNNITTSENSAEDLTQTIDSFIKSNIYGNISLQDISTLVNLSPSYINRLMKRKHKISPMEYYMRLKIEEAQTLLSNNSILIKDVSDMLCFSDQHYFSKVFKLHTGVSPTEYRNKSN